LHHQTLDGADEQNGRRLDIDRPAISPCGLAFFDQAWLRRSP
jgi:hypothetical protein